MNWRHMLFLSCLMAFLLLIVLDGKRNIVKATTESSSEEHLKKNLFVQKLDASKFLKKQAKRSARSSEERDDRIRYESREYESDNTTDEDSEENDRIREWDEYYD